jgi:hypothetical protein
MEIRWAWQCWKQVDALLYRQRCGRWLVFREITGASQVAVGWSCRQEVGQNEITLYFNKLYVSVVFRRNILHVVLLNTTGWLLSKLLPVKLNTSIYIITWELKPWSVVPTFILTDSVWLRKSFHNKPRLGSINFPCRQHHTKESTDYSFMISNFCTWKKKNWILNYTEYI